MCGVSQSGAICLASRASANRSSGAADGAILVDPQVYRDLVRFELSISEMMRRVLTQMSRGERERRVPLLDEVLPPAVRQLRLELCRVEAAPPPALSAMRHERCEPCTQLAIRRAGDHRTDLRARRAPARSRSARRFLPANSRGEPTNPWTN